jgi:predicted nucleotidyltransferase
MALSKDEVIKLASEFLELLCRKHNVRQAYLFGSFVKGQAKDYSDVDLAVVLGSSNRQEGPLLAKNFRSSTRRKNIAPS